jgi:hypothetical protein
MAMDDDDLLLAPFEPCVHVNYDAGIVQAFFEDVAYVSVPLLPGVYHFIDKMEAMDDRRLIGLTIWTQVPKQ